MRYKCSCIILAFMEKWKSGMYGLCIELLYWPFTLFRNAINNVELWVLFYFFWDFGCVWALFDVYSFDGVIAVFVLQLLLMLPITGIRRMYSAAWCMQSAHITRTRPIICSLCPATFSVTLSRAHSFALSLPIHSGSIFIIAGNEMRHWTSLIATKDRHTHTYRGGHIDFTIHVIRNE